ncbi:hypothetical protein JCM10207_002568 [Rhodosporidiobolus poonsookiae]
MDDDTAPVFTIKKRTKSRPSGTGIPRSSSSASLNSPSKLSIDTQHDTQDGQEDEGNVVIKRTGKKTAAGRVKDREGAGAGGVKGKSRLSVASMADDDEDDSAPTVIKRSTPSSTPTSRRLLRPTLPPSSSTASLAGAETASPVAAASSGTYSKEYLDSLKREQRSTPRGAEGAVAEGGYDDLTRSKFGGAQTADETLFPTTDAIARVKARREELRKSGATTGASGAPSTESDYVSLQVGFASKGGESRLVREEDEIGDGDEDFAAYTDSTTTLPLGKRANAEAARRLRAEMGELVDDVAMDVEDEDEEMKAWERAQIRRAGGERREAGARVQGGAKKGYRAAPIPQSSPLPSLTSALSRLSTSLSTLRSGHTASLAALTHFEREREDLDRQETNLRQQVEETERKSEWFDEMKGEVEDWGAFLEEKFPTLESLESRYLSLLTERYTLIASRRFRDASDDVALFTGQAVTVRFPPRPYIEDRAERMDEDGADDAEEDREELAPRSQAREKRRAAREGRLAASSASAPAPIADDALLASDSSDLRLSLTDLSTSLASVFSDVRAPAFRDPALGIRQKFEQWRERYREEYEMTFAGLGMVQVWEFWARVELLGGGWNALEIDELPSSPADLSSYAWHRALSSYGHAPSSSSPPPDDTEGADESTELVNALVTSVVIPRLAAIAKAGYDPYSAKQTMGALRWVEEVSYCVERSSPKFESLIHAFLHRLRLSISHLHSLVLPFLSSLSLPSLAYDPSTFLARKRFLQSQLPLLRACQKWRRHCRALRIPVVVGEDGIEVGAGATFDELVQRELVGRCLLPVVEVAWGTGGEEVAKQILDSLPKDIPPALRRRLEGEQVAGR